MTAEQQEALRRLIEEWQSENGIKDRVMREALRQVSEEY